jgi:hypothetical protein
MLCLTHEAGSDICVGASVKACCSSRRNLARVLRHSGYTAIKDQEVRRQIEIELAEDHLVRWRFQFA